MKERTFTLSDLPVDVVAVEALFEVGDDGGYVMCRIHEGGEWVVWRYFRNHTDVSFNWGHYTTDREDALRNLFFRTGFGQVESLLPEGSEISESVPGHRLVQPYTIDPHTENDRLAWVLAEVTEAELQAAVDAGEAEGEFVGEHTEDISYKLTVPS